MAVSLEQRALRIGVVSALVVLGASLGATFSTAAGESGSTPGSLPGTVVLASGESAFSHPVYPQVGDSGRLVFETDTSLDVVTSGGQVSTLDPNLYFSQVLGDNAVVDHQVGHRYCEGLYSFTDGTVSNLCGAKFVAVSATNLYQVKIVSKARHLFESNFDGSGSVDLGVIGDEDQAGPTGILIGEGTGLMFWPYGESTPIQLDAPGGAFCESLSDNSAGCYTSSSPGDTPLRVPLDGSPAQAVAAASYSLQFVEVTDGATLWRFLGEPTIHVLPTGGGSPTDVPGGWGVVGAGDRYYVATYPGELNSVTDAGQMSTLFTEPLAPLTAEARAASTGRVSWIDDAGLSEDVWSRDVTNVGGTLTVSARDLVATHASAVSDSLSAATHYTAFPQWTANSSNLVTGVSSGSSTHDYAFSPFDDQASGSRLYIQAGNYAARILDLRDGSVQKLGRNADGYNLWGDYLAWTQHLKPMLENLTTKQVETLPATNPAYPPSISAGYVTWSTVDSQDNVQTWLRSLDPTQPVVDVTAQVHGATPEATPDGLLFGYRDSGTHQFVYALLNYQTLQPTVIPVYAARGSFGDDVVSWIDSSGRVLAAPLPHVAHPPIYLGDQFAPSTFANTGKATWKVQIPFSAALTTCSISISQGGTDLADVPCNAQDMTYGSVNTSWNGQTNGGGPAPPGAYTWTLTASNADGPALGADTTPHTFTGALTVTGQ